jgi:excisionase family DNA binding protein
VIEMSAPSLASSSPSSPSSPSSLAPSLFRPSELARFWELHPKTVYLWIREGRLPAVRTPSDQFRLRAADVRAFAEARGLAVPPFAREARARAYVASSSASGPSAASARALRRALRVAEVAVESFASPLDALLACAVDPPVILALDATARGVLLDEAARALRRAARTRTTPLLVYNAPTAAKADALVRAGATRAIVRGKDRDIAPAVAEILAGAP